MKKLALLVPCLGCILSATPGQAADLKQSKLTQVVNDVEIISAAEQREKAAVINDIFAMPDVLRTGAASRAELVAQDQTVTRVGANTIFSFDPATRSIDLKQGSLLFHAPHGKGGGSIHTGAATASVLGTTIIVVTTPNGGFKVLALEGQVLVVLPNGRKQKLAPGQMTFILPGGKKLAPVIIFDLDELVGNSLLVGGFADTLDSWPLIEQEIAVQNQLIHAGRLGNTPFYVGNNATPSQVEVLDPGTVSQQVSPRPSSLTPAETAAASADATINQPSLTDISIPTPPNHVFTTPFSLAGYSFADVSQFEGFLARNIYFEAPEESSCVRVDLCPYAGAGTFDFIALGDIYFDTSVKFKGLSSSDNLGLIAGGKLEFSSGITLSACVNDFLLASPDIMCLNSVTVKNTGNDLTIISGDTISANSAQLYAAGNLTMVANSDLNISGSTLSGSSVDLLSSAGSVTVQNTTFNSQAVVINAANNITVTGNYTPTPTVTQLDAKSGVLLSSSGKVVSDETLPTASFTAGNQIKVSDLDFTQFGYTILKAKTIVLCRDAFSCNGIYNFDTQNGTVTFNKANIGGLSIYNCTMDGTLMTCKNVQLSSGPGTTAGFYSYHN